MADTLARLSEAFGFMRIPEATREMVNPDDRQLVNDMELGDPGTDTWAELYPNIPAWDDPIPLDVYYDMRWANGTVQAMLRVLELPIRATEYSLVPGPNDESGDVLEFVNDVLFRPSYDGGMETPLQQIIEDIMDSLWAGFKAFEKVYAERDGKIVYRKVAPRSCLSMRPVVDKHGNLLGAYQESDWMGQHTQTFIPLYKLLWYAHNMEDSNWYGQSDLRAAYPHYENIRKLYVIDNKAHEVNAIPVRVAKPNIGGVSKSIRTLAFNMIKRIGLDTAVLLPREIDLETFESNSSAAGSRRDSIEHHTSMMAMSVLAHFLQLGTSKSSGYNLSQDQTDFFLMTITAEMDDIASCLTEQLIAPLVKINFGDEPGLCPMFQFADMTDHVRKTTEQVFLAIAQNGNRLSDEFLEALGQRVAKELGLDLSLVERQDDSVPRTTVSSDEMAERQLESFKQMSEAKVAGPGKGNTEGGDNQKASEANKAGLSTLNLSSLAHESDNVYDFFGRVKCKIANLSGEPVPRTPIGYLADINENTPVSEVVELARKLVASE